jgi:hypothetical protein
VKSRDVINHKVNVDLSADQLTFIETRAIFISVGWPPGTRIPDATVLAFYESTNDNFFSRNLVTPDFQWFPFGHIRQRQPKRIGTYYCVEAEERVFK